MTQKDFGPAVSGYLDPDGRAFENAVYQASKPILDKELNLSDELANLAGTSLGRRLAPSGWLSDDALERSDSLSGIFVANTTANTLRFTNNLRAYVNGWAVEIQNTGSNSSNQLVLSVPPVGAGAQRTDLVILEVWRRLISPSPSTDGKSQGGRIWRNGNVKVPSVNDAALNYADDILDATLNSESTKRVQIQYRLRSVTGVDLFTYPSGIDDPTVVANTIPATANAPDGTATVHIYTNQSANGDSGLWRAGDGNPANTLGTVDGYMYAVPLVALFRRNSTAFARNTNHNGADSYPTTTRPDGLYADVFVINDVIDLRRITKLTGWSSYQEIGEKNFGYLLDNVLKTEWTQTTVGAGMRGHSVLWADEIGTLPGDGVITGDTPGANFIGQLDCTRRTFSDRPVYEVMTFQIIPGDPNISTATWQNGTVVTLNPAQLVQYPYSAGSIGWFSRAPTGTKVIDVLRVWIQDTSGAGEYAEVAMSAQALTVTPNPWPVSLVTGIGVTPSNNILITLGTPPVGGFTTEPMYVDLLIAYPPGQGLTYTPSKDLGASTFDGPALPVIAPVNFSSVEYRALDRVHREVTMLYRANTTTITFPSNSTGVQANYALPERVGSLGTVLVDAAPVVANVDPTSKRILTFAVPPSPGSTIQVPYQAARPYPQNSGVQMTIYYEARAPQSIRSSILGTSATLVPRWISPNLYCLTAGSASQGEAYPYPYAYVQTGGVLKDGATWAGEHELDGSVEMFISDFDAATGFVKVPAYIPYVPAPDEVTFTRILGDTDIEGRTFFPTVPPGYQPNAFGQGLSNERVHKVILPSVMETSVDTSFGPKGSLYLVLLVRWAAFDSENSVKFLSANNTTTASIFRVSGNLINRRS
jgi:hypothetical protein